jgi:hypothetical protein
LKTSAGNRGCLEEKGRSAEKMGSVLAARLTENRRAVGVDCLLDGKTLTYDFVFSKRGGPFIARGSVKVLCVAMDPVTGKRYPSHRFSCPE